MGTIEEDPTWQALTQCQIMMPLGRLLQLVPRFTEGLNNPKPVVVLTYFTNPSEGPTVVDANNPTVRKRYQARSSIEDPE